jgi:hypothetical protein
MNRLREKINKARNGHYWHAIEISSVYEFEEIVRCIIQESEDEYTLEEYIEFFQSMEIYYYTDEEEKNDDDEHNLYNMDIREIVESCYVDII